MSGLPGLTCISASHQAPYCIGGKTRSLSDRMYSICAIFWAGMLELSPSFLYAAGLLVLAVSPVSGAVDASRNGRADSRGQCGIGETSVS